MDTTSDVVSAWLAIDAGFNAQDTKYHEKYWKAWQCYSTTWNIDAFLQYCEQIYIIIVITAFTSQVQQGYYIKGLQIKVTTVAIALSSIRKYIHLVGK